MSGTDPIEILRDAFDQIAPTEPQLASWRARATATNAHVQGRHRASRAVAMTASAEPVPWRLLGGLAAAAVITLAAVGAVAMQGSAGTRGGMELAERSRAMMDHAIVAVEPGGDMPTARTQPQMEMHLPATGFDHLRMQLDDLRRVISTTFFAADEPRGT